jgi:NADH:ubiquinone oxidoreductase subunit 6 (subunit J)
MRVAIRLLSGATVIIFVMAIGMIQHGGQARATQPSYRWPGLLEALVVVALLALTILLSSIASALGRVAPIRAKERL